MTICGNNKTNNHFNGHYSGLLVSWSLRLSSGLLTKLNMLDVHPMFNEHCQQWDTWWTSEKAAFLFLFSSVYFCSVYGLSDL